MPLIIEGGRLPHWESELKRKGSASYGRHSSGFHKRARAQHLNIALINNMPDAALEDTELQFFDLLDEASGDLPVYLKLYSLTGVPRTERGQRHLDSFYQSLDELWQSQLDGVIVTGTEPRQPKLQDEPYWKALTDIFDWAERNTISTVLSCLAAHAGVLHSDGIPRHPLSDKQFGVFTFDKGADHQLTAGTTERIRFPHSRWNEVRADALRSCGYTVLTQSDDGGVDCFVKMKQKSLFVHFQGHPEYVAGTLLKEYRRDIKRFLRKERETYPTMPKGYFDEAGARLVSEFRESVICDPREELIDGFPDATLAAALQRTWQPSASAVYRNWLHYMASQKADISKLSVVPAIAENRARKHIPWPAARQKRGTYRH